LPGVTSVARRPLLVQPLGYATVAGTGTRVLGRVRERPVPASGGRLALVTLRFAGLVSPGSLGSNTVLACRAARRAGDAASLPTILRLRLRLRLPLHVLRLVEAAAHERADVIHDIATASAGRASVPSARAGVRFRERLARRGVSRRALTGARRVRREHCNEQESAQAHLRIPRGSFAPFPVAPCDQSIHELALLGRAGRFARGANRSVFLLDQDALRHTRCTAAAPAGRV